MIVFVAGMQRSGSTFAFNVARDVLRQRGSLYQEATFEIAEQLEAAQRAQHVLLKSHQMDRLGIALAQHGAIKVICSIRRPEDAVASWMQTFGFSEDDAVQIIRQWLAFYDEIKGVALTVPYETIDRYPLIVARRIGRFLFRDVGWTEAVRIARRHAKRKVQAAVEQLARSDGGVKDIGFSYYDTKTFFHRRHVSSLRSQPADARLPAEQAARIRAAFQRPQ
jgi:hypothetical protein